MKAIELKVTRIGNSRGVRLPAPLLRRHHITDTLILVEHPDEIVLRPKRTKKQKLSWEETAKAMAFAKEDWSGWDCTLADGLNEL
ncbi:MAG: AbrB/MazE/SpoVT family DNA-binding domain-containing protein [Verrucomicrobia bacterium]|nr:AbrB/MazE/SpoVT family DNA-binding domain-containing protein [Verrucomicrobiota bacterium]